MVNQEQLEKALQKKLQPKFSQAERVKNFRVNRKIVPKINRKLKKISGFSSVVFPKEVDEILKEEGLVLVDTDGMRSTAIFLGREGRTKIEIAGYDKKAKKWKITTNMLFEIIWKKQGNNWNITLFIS